MLKKVGPGVLVAAAFIGPGTVTACTLAGASYGFALLWAMMLSIIATIVLQEMSARLGIITQKGLADVIKLEIPVPWARNLLISIILAAIVFGNAAYEAGNISGATLGLEAIFGNAYTSLFPLIVGICAAALLLSGNYKMIEKVFVALVVIMSLSFVATAIITKPNIIDVLKGLFLPRVPQASILTIMALVGTTVVPYNLFLHASLVQEKWKSFKDLKTAKNDTLISITLGGLVSVAIIVAASAIQGEEVGSVLGLSKALYPLYGDAARYFIGIGLFAAGITSAITAPLAAAYVANSCFGWNAGLNDLRFKMVWSAIIIIGVLFSSLGYRPIETIKFAQIANGILLPIIAVFLLWVINRPNVMGKYKNSVLQNVIGALIVLLALVLGIKSIDAVIGIF